MLVHKVMANPAAMIVLKSESNGSLSVVMGRKNCGAIIKLQEVLRDGVC